MVDALQRNKPLGVKAISLFGIVVGTASFILAIIAIIGSYLISTLIFLRFPILVLGEPVAIFGLVYAVVGYILYTGDNWAWWVAVAFYGSSIIISMLSLTVSLFSIIPLAISALILYYMTRVRVRAYFGV